MWGKYFAKHTAYSTNIAYFPNCYFSSLVMPQRENTMGIVYDLYWRVPPHIKFKKKMISETHTQKKLVLSVRKQAKKGDVYNITRTSNFRM